MHDQHESGMKSPRKITFRWPEDSDDTVLDSRALTALRGRSTRVDLGDDEVLWEAVVREAIRVRDGDIDAVLIQIELVREVGDA